MCFYIKICTDIFVFSDDRSEQGVWEGIQKQIQLPSARENAHRRPTLQVQILRQGIHFERQSERASSPPYIDKVIRLQACKV